MLKKRIAYEDFDGNKREEDFYFNLTRAELTELELSLNGGLTTLLEKIVQEKDNAKIVQYFKEIVLRAYGEKSNDGKYFVKNEETRARFESCAAYDELMVQFFTDVNNASDFINGIMPKEIPVNKNANNVVPMQPANA